MKHFNLISATIFLFVFSLSGCQKKEVDQNEIKETITTGNTTILVDETVKPIIEDLIAVFENDYEQAKVTLIAKSESECVNDLMSDKEKIVVLSRNLSKQEADFFESNKIYPKITSFAKDGIALITNKSANDSLIDFEEIIRFVKGVKSEKFKGLVFDNPNSSTVRYICEKAGIDKLPQEGIFSFATNEEVISYIAENSGMIGVIGINSLFQPSPEMREIVERVNVLKVKYQSEEYFYPTQESIAEGTYPLARVLFIINRQGNAGLGMGLASFFAGEKGQRIILKSGLSPVRIPGRDIIIR
ncbi:MAG: substrate-binding domain-containing protein [Flavobacteriaceae bacterium]|jgi:phosphate transport system substrate-binding protein|nr:substrate-binding domain-containing protein [Flavobacteriaceae bacterium]